MVAVFMRIKDLRNVPACCLGSVQAFFVIQRIDGQGLSGFGAGDQVVEVPVGIGGPDLFDDHGSVLCDGNPGNDSAK